MQKVLTVSGLPDAPADAAALFHGRWLPEARRLISALIGDDPALLLVMPEADHTHAEWRLAAVRMLAREAAPARVNCVGCDGASISRFAEFLENAPGVTGQYLPANFQLGRQPA